MVFMLLTYCRKDKSKAEMYSKLPASSPVPGLSFVCAVRNCGKSPQNNSLHRYISFVILHYSSSAMVLFFTASDGHVMYMGRDKYENEDLIKYGLPEDLWFHVRILKQLHGCIIRTSACICHVGG